MSDVLRGLAEVMPLSQEELLKLIRSSPMRYKVYTIPKRTPGQFRTIAQPAREVKALQYWIMSNFLAQFPVDQAAMAYRLGVNIADNAQPHARSRFLLKLDFKDFFPSIQGADFKRFCGDERAVGLRRRRRTFDADPVLEAERHSPTVPGDWRTKLTTSVEHSSSRLRSRSISLLLRAGNNVYAVCRRFIIFGSNECAARRRGKIGNRTMRQNSESTPHAESWENRKGLQEAVT